MNSYSTHCVDASFIVRLIESGTRQTTAARLWTQWHEAGDTIVAPTLLFYETSNALYRLAQHTALSFEQATNALRAVMNSDIELHGSSFLHLRALELAQEYGLKAAYDAHYLALSEYLDADFWTADRRLARAVQPQLDWVHQIES